MNYDPILMQNIMAWIGGVAAVNGLTAKVKALVCWLIEKKKPIQDKRVVSLIGYGSSMCISFATPALYLWLTDQWGIKLAILMGISIWMTASGLYDQFHTKEQ